MSTVPHLLRGLLKTLGPLLALVFALGAEAHSETITVHITTGAFENEVSWTIRTDPGGVAVDGRPYNFYGSGACSGGCSEDINLAPGDYTFTAYDSFGDGWNGGTWSIDVPGTGTIVSPTHGNFFSSETVTFTVAPGTNTSEVIANFLSRRADVIAASDPDLSGRLDGGGGSAMPLGFAAGDSLDHFNFAFGTSLSAIAAKSQYASTRDAVDQVMAYAGDSPTTRPATGQDLAVAGYDQPMDAGRAAFDAWVKGQWAHVDDESRESDIGLLYLGADYLINPALLFGVLAQFDWMDESDDSAGSSADGFGWMVGPYMVARLHQNLIFDGRLAWGQSDNNVNPTGSYTDDFDTERWLAKAQLTGDFRRGNWRFSPHVAAIYFEEHQKSYVDSLAATIPSQTISLGRVTFGPEFSYVFRANGLEVEPRIALAGIWDFDKAEVVDLGTGLAAGSSEDLRARVEGGIAFRLAGGAALTADAFYDGIGVNGLDMYGGSVKVNVPLN